MLQNWLIFIVGLCYVDTVLEVMDTEQSKYNTPSYSQGVHHEGWCEAIGEGCEIDSHADNMRLILHHW